MNPFPRSRGFSLRLLLSALAAAALAGQACAQKLDPDPDLFDGTRTKPKDAIQQEEPQSVDDWEDANLIIYDSDEEGSEEGGQGRAGYKNPGYEEGVPGGQGSGPSMSLPIPMGGGGGGNSEQQGIPGMIPQGTPGAEGGEGNMGSMPPGELGASSAVKPDEMAIGDPNNRIKQTAANTASADASADPGGVSGSGKQGEDTTQVPKAASGAQSGTRGGGVEKGDAMPSDL